MEKKRLHTYFAFVVVVADEGVDEDDEHEDEDGREDVGEGVREDENVRVVVVVRRGGQRELRVAAPVH